MGGKGRKKGASTTLLDGEARERSRRTGKKLVKGKVSRRGNTVVINAGGSPIPVGAGRAKSLLAALENPKLRGKPVTIPVSSPPPARLVRLSPVEIRKAVALARQVGLLA